MSVFVRDEFHGPYELSQYEEMLHEGEIGVYVFCDVLDNPKYVGRSDKDLATRLRSWLGTYERFYVEYHTSEVSAYLRECELYHGLGGDRGELDNERHPARPPGSNCRCPWPGCPHSFS